MMIKDYISISQIDSNSSIKSLMLYVSVVNNIPIEDLYELDIDSLVERYNNSPFDLDSSARKQAIEIFGNTLYKVECNSITLGEFIDMEYYISEDWLSNISEIVAILYRIAEKEPLKKLKYEEYSEINIDERAKLIFDGVNINDIYGSIIEYVEWRSNIFNSYTFWDDGLDDIDPDELEGEEKEIYDEEIERMELSRKNMWEDILSMVSDGDVTKYNDILGTNIFLVFNTVARKISDSRKINNSNK